MDMEQEIYTIILSDGTVLTDLGLNGNNFVSKTPIDPAIFENNCSPVMISDGENNITHENMELVQITPMGNEYWFILRDISEDELRQIKMRSDIVYIAMMTNVEL